MHKPSLIQVLRMMLGLALLSEASLCHASVYALVSEAEMIVVGKISTRVESSTNVSFDIDTDRVIKGDRNTLSVHVSHDWQSAALISSNSVQVIRGTFCGIWSLIRKNSEWDVLPTTRDGFIFSLFSPAVEKLEAPYLYSSGTQPLDALVYEVGAQFEKRPSTTDQMIIPPTVSEAAADTILNRYVNSSNVILQANGVAGMLARSQPGALGQLQRLWPQIKGSPLKWLVISKLRNSFRADDPRSIAELIAIAEDEAASDGLRTASMKSISAVHTKESLPFLASLLSSSDTEERTRGIIGISSFANGCPPQTPANLASMEYMQFKNPSPYRTTETIDAFAFGPLKSEREAQLVEFWTDWWNQHKTELMK